MQLLTIPDTGLFSKIRNALILAVVAAALGYGYMWHQAELATAIVATETRMQTKAAEQRTELLNKSAETTARLYSQLDKTKQEKQDEIQAIHHGYSIIIASLQDRPTNRRTDLPGNPGDTTTQGATGLQLSRPDGEFLAGFARSTAELQTELKACYKQYETVRIEFQRFKQATKNP